MIVHASTLDDGATISADVVVIGAGPAGIVTALELGRRGLSVALLESGNGGLDPAQQELARAADLGKADNHAPVELAVRRQVGGTSSIWGGRCVPYDPIDFQVRPIAGDAEWPVTYDDVVPYFERASDWMKCGRPVFSAHDIPTLPPAIVPGLADDEDVTASSLERWSLPTNFGTVYAGELRRSSRVTVFTELTATELVSSTDGKIVHATCRTLDGKTISAVGTDFVVAAGGLETTRMLMHSKAPAGDVLGDHSGHLGHWYMAHLEGVIAKVELSTPPTNTIYGYERDVDGTYVRRRFALTNHFLTKQDLPNITGWLTNPELADARHGSPDLSFVYLALTSPLGPKFAPDAQRLSLTGHRVPGTPYGHTEISPRRDHVSNVIGHPIQTAKFAMSFGVKRVIKPGRRAPGFFTYSPSNVYPMQYHSEHLPQYESRVWLSDEYDALGMRRLAVDLKFADADVDGVIRAHREWDAFLQRRGVGRLNFLHEDLAAAVRERSGGGFHQVGTTRMATRADDGVVDANMRVFGADNAYIASSSTFVTSGQANSTFMIVAFAIRLADHLVRGQRRL